MQEFHTRLRNFNLCVRTGGGKPPKTAERIYSRRIQRRGMAGIGSAPWGRKTTRSGNMLKTGIGRGQLSFASDNPSSNPNACPLISTFSKPHSEVASTTHTSALKRFRRDAQRFSTFIRPGVHTSKCRIVKVGPKGDAIDKPKLSPHL